jgi:hypothetical protein
MTELLYLLELLSIILNKYPIYEHTNYMNTIYSSMRISFYNEDYQKSLMIPKGQSESVNQRRTDNTVSKSKSTITGQTTIYQAYI